MTSSEIIEKSFNNAAALQRTLFSDPMVRSLMETIAGEITQAFRNDKKILFCGNGGSAADAQHLAAEFTGKFYIDRRPLYAEALHVNTSYVTAVANDYTYDEIYSRLITAKGRAGDILIGISTSGNSKNVINALKTANDVGMTTVGFTGNGGGKMREWCRYLVDVPSKDTPRIQETHILMGHIICEIVETQLFRG
jgi:D-sedoheptulose 7-phosphate isomerase